MNTFQLQAAATLVSIGGTGAADRGWVTSPAFQEWARKLSDQAVSARSAVTAKNQMALRTAGDTLVDTCNACHKQFKPDVPTEGIFLKRGHPGANY
jgi:cytochrome c556